MAGVEGVLDAFADDGCGAVLEDVGLEELFDLGVAGAVVGGEGAEEPGGGHGGGGCWVGWARPWKAVLRAALAEGGCTSDVSGHYKRVCAGCSTI